MIAVHDFASGIQKPAKKDGNKNNEDTESGKFGNENEKQIDRVGFYDLRVDKIKDGKSSTGSQPQTKGSQ